MVGHVLAEDASGAMPRYGFEISDLNTHTFSCLSYGEMWPYAGGLCSGCHAGFS